jgi:membrane protein YqaA with SNARE-associated domain
MQKLENFFQKDNIFEYNETSKRMNSVLLFSSFFPILIIGLGILFLKMDFQKANFPLYIYIDYLITEIQSKSFLGLFLTSFLGGLFFFFFPLEIYFFSILTINSTFSSILLPYVLGVICAQFMNYWLGLRLNRLCIIFIPPKNFYKMKGLLNKWGIWMILLMNMMPLPSPVFSTVLGAFKYNFKKFSVFAILGILILYFSIFLANILLNKFNLELF